ncbi:MAG: hypothetical protein H6828_02080 [Planctomycetes bacterium]|nr:hypothetical protein [Planctomycetota bacterium]
MEARLEQVAGVELVGSGAGLPRDVDASLGPLTSADAWARLLGAGWRAELARRGWHEAFAEESWGVRTRHAFPLGGPAHSEELAVVAARAALADAGLAPGEVAQLVVGTNSPARLTSSLASRVARALGTGGASFDVRAGGASGLAAWTQAALGVAAGAGPALVVAVDCVPDFLAREDLTNHLLFGCAAAALVLRRAPEQRAGLVASRAGRVDAEGRAFTVPGALPPRAGERYLFQAADASYLEALAETWQRALAALRELGGAQATHLVPYAVTRGQLERVRAALGREVATPLAYLAEFGCTGAASPLHQVHLLRAAGALAPGDELALVAVGGGIHWQALTWRV